MQKLTMEQIRDIEEPADLEENDRIEEEYHISMLAALQPGSLDADIHREAAQALRAASPLSWKQFFRKWG